MNDGIDHQAYCAKLRAANTADRKRYARELGAWMRCAALPARRQAYWGFGFLAVGIGLALLSFEIDGSGRALRAIGLVMIALGQWPSWIRNKHARHWRRANPFEEWRTSQTVR